MADFRARANTNTLSPVSNNGWADLAVDRLGGMFTSDLSGLAARAAAAGRLIVASDADQNDQLTGQTSFADTTPTLLLNVPDGSAAIPLWVKLSQAGTVAGDFIDIIIEADNIAAYASGGTAETLYYFRNGGSFTTGCAVYSGATATAGYGVALHHERMAEDVDPASADASNFRWSWVPDFILPLVGPASLKVFTFAGTTGPTWRWSVGFADVPAAMFTN